MAQELVRVRVGKVETNVGRAYATKNELEVLDEPTHNEDGSPRRDTRAGGRARKPKTSVDKAAAAKKTAAVDSAPSDEGVDR